MTSRMVLRFVMVASLATIGPVAVVDSVGAQTDESNEATWVSQEVPDTDIVVLHPAAWSSVATAPLQAKAGKDGTVLLAVVDVAGNQDNFVINRFTGDSATWFSGLRDYRKQAQQSASFSDGKVLSVAKTRVGRMTAYSHLEKYVDPSLGKPVIYGDLEIREGKNSVITLAGTIAADRPHARKTMESLVDSVAAKTNG